MSLKTLYDLGETPSLGEVPEKMHAFTVRQDRFGEPTKAWQREVINTPSIGLKDVLVYVMATGINYNNVWAALGYPVDVIADRQKKGEPEDFHAAGRGTRAAAHEHQEKEQHERQRAPGRIIFGGIAGGGYHRSDVKQGRGIVMDGIEGDR